MCRIDIGEGASVSGSVRAKLSQLADRIRRERDVDRIILYGSFARGDFHEGRDISLVIIADFSGRFHKRCLEITGTTEHLNPFN